MFRFKKLSFISIYILLTNTIIAKQLHVLYHTDFGKNVHLRCDIKSFKKTIFATTIQGYKGCVAGDKNMKRFIDLTKHQNQFLEIENLPHAKFRLLAFDKDYNSISITSMRILPSMAVPVNLPNSSMPGCDNDQDLVHCGKNVRVITPSYNEILTGLPGCIDLPQANQNACGFSGSFRPNDVIAMRLKYEHAFDSSGNQLETNHKNQIDYYSIQLDTQNNMAHAAGSLRSFIMAISEVEGDFAPLDPGCRALSGSGKMTLYVTDQFSKTAKGQSNMPLNHVCPLKEGKTYYINARPYGGTTKDCGKDAKSACRYQLFQFLPTH